MKRFVEGVDRGRACEEAGITVTLPKPLTSAAKAAGRFGKQDFIYAAAEDIYRCPAGERLTYRFRGQEDGKTLHRYWTAACQSCALKAQCTTGRERRIARWEHEAVLERVQDRLDRNPNAMGVRRQTAEHPFGAMKCWMGATHFSRKSCRRWPPRWPQRARLQHEARDDDRGRRRIAARDAGVRPALLDQISPLNGAPGSTDDRRSIPEN